MLGPTLRLGIPPHSGHIGPKGSLVEVCSSVGGREEGPGHWSGSTPPCCFPEHSLTSGAVELADESQGGGRGCAHGSLRVRSEQRAGIPWPG